nr:MAG TPA: hypothetical protein [Caudoviricetes sp.]
MSLSGTNLTATDGGKISKLLKNIRTSSDDSSG